MSAVQKYLERVIQLYGRGVPVGNLNCVNGWGGPFRPGEHASVFGLAGDLLDACKRGENVYLPGIGEHLSDGLTAPRVCATGVTMPVSEDDAAAFMAGADRKHRDWLAQPLDKNGWLDLLMRCQNGYATCLYVLEKIEADKTTREKELEDLLQSARAIADRRGEDTAWRRFSERLDRAGISAVTPKVFRLAEEDDPLTA